MDITNSTANQHFLSTAEQQLNALNPNARLSNQRIHSFSLIDREAYRVELDGPRGRSISTNLTLRDLFSFSVIEGEQDRLNLEAQFNQYEGGIKTNTLELLRKLRTGERDIKSEVLGLFVSKFMDFLRNPYSIHKVLNTIGRLSHINRPILSCSPIILLSCKGRNPIKNISAEELGIDTLTYQRWLAALFMALFRPAPDLPNLMEGIIKAVFESRAHSAQVAVFQFVDEHSDKRCLLCDRAFINPIQDEMGLSFSFNLNATAFINYTFFDIDRFAAGKVPQRVIEHFKAQPRDVQLQFVTNRLDALVSYNRNVVYQCARKVYCSSKTVYGVM